MCKYSCGKAEVIFWYFMPGRGLLALVVQNFNELLTPWLINLTSQKLLEGSGLQSLSLEL